MGKPHT
ncbi:hypothetical protein D046_4990, partial [Vibrio parahaemolyticus V-223/04]